MPTHGKPTVFVSSTIYDFADLRGALKFWLEEGGFEVWMSEYNDMDKLPDANTFDACLESICRADYYILLIGEKRGSTYSQAEGVSITQQEYRAAYRAFLARGRPLPLLFARADKKNLVDGWEYGGGTGEPPFKDASFVRDFMAEVRRQGEQKNAVQGIGTLPLANWLHPFHDFREIIDALRVGLALRVDVAYERLMSAITLDLEVMLSALLGKSQYRPAESLAGAKEVTDSLEKSREAGEDALRQFQELVVDIPSPPHRIVAPVVESAPFDKDARGDVTLDHRQMMRMSLYLTAGLPPADTLYPDC